MGGVKPRNTGLAHRERGVVRRRGVENPRTTREEVRHGLEDSESDSHHLRGSRCSSWAPRTLGLLGNKAAASTGECSALIGLRAWVSVLLSCCWQPGLVRGVCGLTADQPIARLGARLFKILLVKLDNISTLGIELRVLLGLIAKPSGNNQPNSLLKFLAFSVLSSCPGNGGMAEIMTLDGPVAVQLDDGEKGTRTLGLGKTAESCVNVAALLVLLRYALSDLPWGSACCGPAGETTANFTCWTFATRLSTAHSEDRQTPKTGRRDSKCVSGLKTVVLAYGDDIGSVGCSMFARSRPSCQVFNVSESGDCESVHPFENQMDARAGVGRQQVVTSRTRPVVPLGWGKIRWLKRREMAVYHASLGPSQSCSVTTGLSSCLSSRLSICPPPVRSAPGISSFPSLPSPSPPARSAFCGDDVGDRLFVFRLRGLSGLALLVRFLGFGWLFCFAF